MATTITTKELYEIIKITPDWQNIMLSGRHGIGKSRILSDYFEKEGFKVVPLFLGQMSDPGDLIGLPDRDSTNAQTRFLPPYWFPKDDTPVILFLDELNRARPEVLQAIMDLALNRTIAGRALPKGSRVISAVNEGDEYQLTDLDPALVSRFNIYRFDPTPQEWVVWARGAGIDERIINFIEAFPAYLDSAVEKTKNNDETLLTGLEKSPDRRAWEKVSGVITGEQELGTTHLKAVSGIIGERAAAKFFSFASRNAIVSGKQVLENFDGVENTLKKYDISRLTGINDSIMGYLETLPENEIKSQMGENLFKYVNFLLDNGFKEAVAQFASNIANASYPNATAFMTKHSPEVFKICIEFVKEM